MTGKEKKAIIVMEETVIDGAEMTIMQIMNCLTELMCGIITSGTFCAPSLIFSRHFSFNDRVQVYIFSEYSEDNNLSWFSRQGPHLSLTKKCINQLKIILK